MIVSVEGFKGVGKTTLIAGLKAEFPHFLCTTGEQKLQCLKMNPLKEGDAESNFYFTRRILVAYFSDIWERRTPGQTIIFDRGPEELEYFTLHYPRQLGCDWNVEKNLNRELDVLRRMKSDLIVFLDVEEEVLSQRRRSAAKKRSGDAGTDLLNSKHMRSFFERLPCVRFLDTSSLNPCAVVDAVKIWIR
jgi:thymidylate kinase